MAILFPSGDHRICFITPFPKRANSIRLLAEFGEIIKSLGVGDNDGSGVGDEDGDGDREGVAEEVITGRSVNVTDGKRVAVNNREGVMGNVAIGVTVSG